MSDETKAVIESSRAVQEVAKTANKAIGTAEKFGGFISTFLSGPLQQGVGIFEDKLRYMRWERQVRLMNRVQQIMSELGQSAPTKTIPLKLAVPFFHAASMEDSDDLQDMWAKLLVNGSLAERGVELRRVYIDILERLSPIEALILEKIYSLPITEQPRKAIVTGCLPDEVFFEETETEEMQVPSEEVVMALANLTRLGCMKLPTAWNGGEIYRVVYPTVIGQNLVKACKIDVSI